MLGFGPIGSYPIGALPHHVAAGRRRAAVTVSNLIIPEHKTEEGILIRSTAAVWNEIAEALGDDWSLAFQIPPHRWEEIVAGAFHKEGYHEVILTPRSGDLGRDVIAIKHGVGCVKVIGSVKAFAPDNEVGYEYIREFIGVLTGEPDASKGIIATTSRFPAKVHEQKNIAPFLPTRLELMDGEKLQKWLSELSKSIL
jgi:restriction system protein